MSTCVEKLKCKDCGRNSRQVFYNDNRDNYTSWCFVCHEQKGDPYNGDKPSVQVHVKSPEEKLQEARELLKCKTLHKDFRGIPAKYFRSWGVKILLSEYDGKTPFALGFPYTKFGKLAGWKARLLKKKDFFAIGDTRGADLFGLERALKVDGDTLYITEGEFDAIALDYALVESNSKGAEKYRENMYSVVSLCDGGGSILKDLEQAWSRICKFPRIVLVLDDDEVGIKAEIEASKFSDRILIANKPKGCKDANDAVKQNKIDALVRMVQYEATRSSTGEELW